VSRWSDDGLVPDDGGAVGRVLVADSWLVEDGRVRALDVHRQRFAGSVADAAPDLTSQVEAFWSACVAELPREGAWFPRVELVAAAAGPSSEPGSARRARSLPGSTGTPWLAADGSTGGGSTGGGSTAGGSTAGGSTGGGGVGEASTVAGPGPRLRLHLRPAPERRSDVVLATSPVDPRTAPLVKGPDLAALGALREAAAPRGAEEAVLLGPDGTIVEGAWSSIVWWEGDALCLPPADVPRLPGVTLRTVLALAAALGVEVHHERRRPDELDGLEVWSLSALHGARIATRWVDGPALAEQPGRLRAWRARLDALRRPL